MCVGGGEGAANTSDDLPVSLPMTGHCRTPPSRLANSRGDVVEL